MPLLRVTRGPEVEAESREELSSPSFTQLKEQVTVAGAEEEEEEEEEEEAEEEEEEEGGLYREARVTPEIEAEVEAPAELEKPSPGRAKYAKLRKEGLRNALALVLMDEVACSEFRSPIF